MKVKVICVATAMFAFTTGLAQAAQNSAASDLVKRECSACHGPRGISVAPMFPNLAGQQAVYLRAQLNDFTRGLIADDVGLCGECAAESVQDVSTLDSDGLYPDDHAAGAAGRIGRLLVFQNLWPAIFVIDRRLHGRSP